MVGQSTALRWCFGRSQRLRWYRIEVFCTVGDQGVCWKWWYVDSPLQTRADGNQRIDLMSWTRLNHLGRQPNHQWWALSVFSRLTALLASRISIDKRTSPNFLGTTTMGLIDGVGPSTFSMISNSSSRLSSFSMSERTWKGIRRWGCCFGGDSRINVQLNSLTS